ncbi:MAG: tetratricopeptide repeat protein [Armatimonadota bacterium]
MQKQPPGDDAYLMLVTANVLRLRRQFELAEAQCGEVLRRDPANAAGHSVMGDILRDQGKLKEAIEWYKMALDLNPGNVSDRKKLEAVIDRAYPRENGGPIGRLRENVAEQISASSAEMRAARLPLGVYIALGAMLAVIIGVTLIVLALGRRAAPAAPPAAVAQSPSGAFIAGPLEPKEPTGDATEKTAPAPRFAEEVAPLEIDLLDQLQREARVVDPNCQVTAAEIDPRDGTVQIHFSMPRLWSPDGTRMSILRVAAPLARTAVAWDTRVSGVRVRCDVRQEGQPDKSAFVAEADLERLAAAPAGPDERGADEAAFPDPWWEPELSPAATPHASPPPVSEAPR